MTQKVSRRAALTTIAGTVGGLAVGGAIGYLARTPQAPQIVQNVTQTVAQTASMAPSGYTFYLVSCDTQEDQFFSIIYKGFMDECQRYGVNGKYVQRHLSISQSRSLFSRML